jgi:predicted ester cyclase
MAATIDNTSANKELAKTIASMLWKGEYDEIETHLTADYVGHDPMVPEGLGDVDAMRKHFGAMYDAMDDVTYEVLDIVAEGDHVFHRGRLSGTHTGEFMGVPATNERLVFEDIMEWRFEDGKLAETWAQHDDVGLMRQLGLEIPGPN